MKRACYLFCIALILYVPFAFSGTTGKIAGTVTDSRTGEKLVSANVVLEGTRLGAVANVDGYYVILNVPPGTYTINASLVGYTTTKVTNVRVEIDQTTPLDIRLTEEMVQTSEVTVIAERPVVRRDVAASTANIELAQVEKLPVMNVAGVVALQAGVQGGLVIRGGTADQTAFILDGFVLRDERTNQPYTKISLSSIEEVQVQTGGFTAEYGDLRSGAVNVVTKEGNRERYNLSFIGRYAPARPKHFGPSIYEPNSYWLRPYLDPAVAWTGTGKDYEPGAWDKWTRDQYPYFQGWNARSAELLADSDPTNDLSPQAAQRLFLWEHRRQAEVQDADFDIDMGFGGPFPFISKPLGDLRFFFSYRQSRNMYLIPLSDDAYRDYNGQLKVTSDITGSMKLTLSGLIARSTGTNSNNTGDPGFFVTPGDVANVLDRVSYIDARIFATDYWAPTKNTVRMFGAKLSHTINNSTFYEVTASRFESKTRTNPGTLRNTDRIYQFGNSYFVDEAPFGYQPNPSTGITGLRMGVGFSNSRDTSNVTVWGLRFDMTSQLDKYNQVKGGVELNYTDNKVASASVDVFLPSGRSRTSWHTYPIRGAAYLQDKLEFEGMVANLGLRLDYLNPNGEWYENYDPYNTAFSGQLSPGIDTLLQKSKTKPILTLSPRLAVAFPISDEAKFFFNYGHYRQVPDPRNLFLLRRYSDNNQVINIADPTAPFPRTVAYELGYEHSVLEEYLIRVSAYYKDITNESQNVTYYGNNGDFMVQYSRYTSNRYRDIRGVELSLSKNRGNWVQGFANYTYDVRTTGYFGLVQYHESAADQRKYERNNIYQEKPIPRPYARVNLDLFTPPNLGPEVGGLRPLGDWRVNFLGSWSSGYYFTWAGGGSVPGLEYNVQWRDYYGLDMRVSKNFQFGRLNLQFFADISNLFNIRNMSEYGFVDGSDYNAYMRSLHLPAFSAEFLEKIGYVNIPGSDRPGDYRKPGVEYQPIVAVAKVADLDLPQNLQTRPFYWVRENNQYYQYVNGAWQAADQAKVNKALDDKAYIDMPNMDTFTFLNPRQIFYGIRMSFDI